MAQTPKQPNQENEKNRLKALWLFLLNKKNLPLVASLLGGTAVVTTSAILLAPQPTSSSQPSSEVSSSSPSSTPSSSESSVTSSSTPVSSEETSNSSSEATVQYTVTFDAMGGSSVESQTVNEGSLLTEPSSTYGIMLVEGWYTSDDDGVTLLTSWDFASNAVTTDLTLYANWEDPFLIQYSRFTNGGEDAIFLDQNSQLSYWGNNSPLRVPLPFPELDADEKVIHITSSESHVLALTDQGQLFGYGDNDQGELNTTDTNIETMTLIPVPLETGETVLNVWAGYSSTYVLTSFHRLLAIGENYDGELGVPHNDDGSITTFTEVILPDVVENERIINFAHGDYGSFATTNFGNVYAWGYQWDGRLGIGDTGEVEIISTPTKVTFEGLHSQEYIQSISILADHAVALTSQNRIYGWGYNADGEIGIDFSQDTFYVPTLIDTSFLEPSDVIVDIQAGSDNTVVLTRLGRVYQFGENGNYQLGNGNRDSSYIPVLLDTTNVLASEESILSIHPGDNLTIFITNTDDILGIGYNRNNQIIDNSNVQDVQTLTRIRFFSLQDNETFTRVSVAEAHTLALTSDNRLFGWGSNYRHQLLQDQINDPYLGPVAITLPLNANETINQINAVGYSSFALTSDARLFGWGQNEGYFLGAVGEDAADQTTPVEIVFPDFQVGESIRSFSASYYGQYVITTANRVFGWSPYFAIGDGTSDTKSFPTLVTFTGLNVNETIDSVTTNGTQRYALTSEGRVFAWGENNFSYQLGLGDLVDRLEPTLMTFNGLQVGESIASVIGGASNALALTTNNRVYGWGFNAGSQLGNGGVAHVQTPDLIDYNLPNDAQVTSIYSTGGGYFLLTDTQEVYSYGNNGNYQLGHTQSFDYLSPTKVEFPNLREGEFITSISVTVYSAMAITNEGRIYAWGLNDNGKLGFYHTRFDSITPLLIVVSKLIA